MDVERRAKMFKEFAEDAKLLALIAENLSDINLPKAYKDERAAAAIAEFEEDHKTIMGLFDLSLLIRDRCGASAKKPPEPQKGRNPAFPVYVAPDELQVPESEWTAEEKARWDSHRKKASKLSDFTTADKL